MDKVRMTAKKRCFSTLKEKKYKLVRIFPHGGQCWTEINEAGDTGAAWLRGEWCNLISDYLRLAEPPPPTHTEAWKHSGVVQLAKICSIMIFAD